MKIEKENEDTTRGYLQVYTGNGKGKTTAAIGLTIRAVGAGKRVFFAQFVKGMIYSEVKVLQGLAPAVTIKQYGLECFIHKAPTPADVEAARNGLLKVKQIIESGNYDMVVLDEANIALYYQLFSLDEFLEILKNKPSATEIIITGRYAPGALIDMADLVSEMKEIKHYYSTGVSAREGVEF
ncbi:MULTISPECIES: cob(I)yrinic acid a,c-diamide adenosyltransferase [unclassified Carboxylicivirga]|uniref:cob(I)yrinic acid a,c-diamide adenosyltransferase n=1 Tax=Carboxylicivirga TaxID=1628153 RepID=UPI003D344009